ncbi:hypothetical protein [Paenibacillus peoriae]|uniref:hypothetical protein n=1 Tax=Paenibacillus peoriae TaxID=59893 RepID=UPI00215A4551|nr:hypothetical protein [Paenibacillus peoriae]
MNYRATKVCARFVSPSQARMRRGQRDFANGQSLPSGSNRGRYKRFALNLFRHSETSSSVFTGLLKG